MVVFFVYRFICLLRAFLISNDTLLLILCITS
nr:MAG TPA: hypothetical protein [Caudoviricetes sp.]